MKTTQNKLKNKNKIENFNVMVSDRYWTLKEFNNIEIMTDLAMCGHYSQN